MGGRLVISSSQKEGHDPQGVALKQAVQNLVERMKPEVDLAAAMGITKGIEKNSSALISLVDSIL